MKIRFSRTPPAGYEAYIEGEVADLPDQDASYLVGLGVADRVRVDAGDTRMESSRTELVGEDNKTEVVVRGRGANIVGITSPENDELEINQGGDAVTREERRAASRGEAEALVRQEARRHGENTFEDNTNPVDLKGAKAAGKAAAEKRSGSQEADPLTQGPNTENNATDAKGQSAQDDREAQLGEQARKSSGGAPANKAKK